MKKFIHISILLILCFASFLLLSSSDKNIISIFDNKPNEPSNDTELYWAENKLKKMSLDEKIAQLMMIRVHSNYGEDVLDSIYQDIKQYQPGGVCFFKGFPIKQVEYTNRIQEISKIPMLISIDGEWGPSMRLDSCYMFPRQMTMGAMNMADDELIYEMGKEIARQCHALGIHINFAPTVDVNNNPNNPVINSRSFGQSREWVTRKSLLYMKGMQELGISACAKHFPGHGDTETDSHYDLPIINKSRAALDSLEFYPFRKMIEEGVDMVMVSHLNIPALDTGEHSISSVSYKTITMLLRKEMGFDGIIVTDGMDMLGLRKTYPSGGEAEIQALLAGVDILLLPNPLSEVIPAIKEAVANGIISEELINEKCLRILQYKKKKEITHFKKIPTKGLYEKLNSERATEIGDNIWANALTLLKNEKNLLPLSESEKSSTALLCIGGEVDSSELKKLSEEHSVDFIITDRSIKMIRQDVLMQKLKPYNQVIVCILGTNQSMKHNYGVYQETAKFVNELAKQKKVILSLFANPYSLQRFGNLDRIPSVIMAYQSTIPNVKACLNAVFGKTSFKGSLPVEIPGFAIHDGISLLNTTLGFPEQYSALGDSYTQAIDSIVRKGINEEIFPGCQIVALHKGNVVLNKHYGNLTYHKRQPVNSSTLYDVASLTKTMATTLAVMKLYEEGKVSLTDKISKHLPYLANSDKANITIVELLTHTSGLPAFIPFYREIAKNGQWNESYLQKTETPEFSVEVAEKVYMAPHYQDTIRKRISECKLGAKAYIYSDLGFVLLQDMVELLTAMSMDSYLTMHFYQPLGLQNTCFNPLAKKFSKQHIAPTENDTTFRMQLVQGYVHDQTAALFGGVCGNAGLFSTAEDLAVMNQMLSAGGVYNGQRYFKQETVKLFTATYPINNCKQRALGFMTPSFEKKSSILPTRSGKYTFGHQGFTGTVIWCDPDNELIYVFLSNRVYPDVEPNKLSKSKIRLIIHEIIYSALIS